MALVIFSRGSLESLFRNLRNFPFVKFILTIFSIIVSINDDSIFNHCGRFISDLLETYDVNRHRNESI